MSSQKSFFRRSIRTLFLVLNIVLVLVYLMAVLGSFISPERLWIFGPLTLAFPWLALALVFSFFFWLAVKPRYVWLPLFTLLAGWVPLSRTISLRNIKPAQAPENDKPGLHLATWNIQSFNGMSKNRSLKKMARTDIARQLTGSKAEVICLQEFNTSTGPGGTDNLSLFSKEYPYHFFSREFRRNGDRYASGCIVFSRFPIRHQQRIDFPTADAESLIYADVEVSEGRLIRVFTTHLQSFRFSESDHLNINNMQGKQAVRVGLLRKLKTAYLRRAAQAKILRKAMEESPYPAVICGDFNDIPGSYAYNTIRGNWQDAFLEKSWGLGRTYLSLSPTLRIDYILASPRLDVLSYIETDEGLSDHVMLDARLQIR